MYLLRLILKNGLRHKLRTTLTVMGIVVAITAFGLLRTIVDAWYAAANASSSARLVTRNAISLTFSPPLTCAQRIRQVPGVAGGSWANWFGGVYITERSFFPQFAIDAPTYLDMKIVDALRAVSSASAAALKVRPFESETAIPARNDPV
jgi:putative ABC transport system permease protein